MPDQLTASPTSKCSRPSHYKPPPNPTPRQWDNPNDQATSGRQTYWTAQRRHPPPSDRPNIPTFADPSTMRDLYLEQTVPECYHVSYRPKNSVIPARGLWHPDCSHWRRKP